MTKTIRENLKRLQDNASKATAMTNIVAKKKAEFEKSIAPYQDGITRFNQENNDIMNANIEVPFSEILQGIADSLEMSVEDLKVTYKTNIDYTTKSLAPAMACADRFNRNKKEYRRDMTLTFEITPKNNKPIRFSGTINAQTQLGENEFLYHHMEGRAVPQADGSAIYKICLTDFDHLILTYKLYDLVNAGQNGVEPKGKLANIVILAADRYETRKNENQINAIK